MITASFEVLLRSARRALAEGRADEARHLYDKAQTARPDSPEAHYGLATADFLLNDLEDAAVHFKEVTRLDPLRAGAYVNLGAALTGLREYRGAVEALRRGIQLNPRCADGYYNLGLLYRAVRDGRRAIQAFQLTVRLDPQLADAHFNLGNARYDEGDFQGSIDAYRTALELQPDWEKAARALTLAEEALAGAGLTEADEPKVATEDPERRFTPEAHGALLDSLHEAVKAAQAAGIQFLDALREELAPTVHDLTHALIGQQGGVTLDLDRGIQKFEHAVQHFRQAHEALQAHLARAQAIGDRLLQR